MGEAGLARHRADRPVGSVGRLGAKRALDHRGDLVILDRSRPARTSLVQQSFHTILEEAPAPLADRVFVHAQLDRDDLALDAVGATKNDPATFRH